MLQFTIINIQFGQCTFIHFWRTRPSIDTVSMRKQSTWPIEQITNMISNCCCLALFTADTLQVPTHHSRLHHLTPYTHPTHPYYYEYTLMNCSATMRALAFKLNFISLISLSISSMNWMMKSTSLCLYICSVWKLVMRKLMS